MVALQFHSWDFCWDIGIPSRFRFLLDGIVFDENVMLLLPIIRVVVSVTEDKSPVGLVILSSRINLFDNAIRSRNGIKFTLLDDFSSLEAEN